MNFSPLLCALSGASLLVPPVASAEEAGRRVIEEITVTATRREESLQDVPVSVGVVTGEMIRELSLQNLDELSSYVPGLTVREGGEQTGISIRGFGAGLNFGFDQSVGLFIDGIYAGRERQFRGHFLDVNAVEVLRGPQATLFGKNTISGAVVITTGKPTQEFEADFRGEATSVIDRRQAEAVVNVPLTDTLASRVALRWSDQDGYVENTFTGEDEEQQEDWIGRVSFLWEPTENLSVLAKLERSEVERVGRYFNVSDVRGLAVGRPTATGADVGLAAQLSSYVAYDPEFRWGSHSKTSKQQETEDIESNNAVLRLDYETAGGHTLTSITGYSGYESEDQRDVDWSPTNFLFEPITQDFDQWSQEFQFISQVGEKFDYLLGAHLFSNDFYVDRRTDVDINVFLLPFGVPPFDPMPFGGIWRYAQLRFLAQETDSMSAYGQGTYHLTPNWHLTLGLRWNREEKFAEDRFNLSEFGTTRFLDPVNNPADAQLIAQVASVLPANINGILLDSRQGKGSVEERDWSPEATLAWDYNDDMMFYGKVTRGHKGGGFNSATTGQSAEDFEFENETVTGYELGGKLQLADGIARVNFALFRQDFIDLQTSVWVGDGFDVGNAGEARSQGLEMDGTWLIGERLQLNGSFIWLDARFIESEGNACSIPQRNFPNPVPGCVEDPPGTFLQDLSGKRFAPTFQGNAGIGYVAPIGSSLELLLRGDVVYSGEQENPRDPTIAQGARTLVDLSATLRPLDQRWSVGLLVQNAGDSEFHWYEFEAPAQIGTRIGFPGPPRRFSLRASYHM